MKVLIGQFQDLTVEPLIGKLEEDTEENRKELKSKLIDPEGRIPYNWQVVEIE